MVQRAQEIWIHHPALRAGTLYAHHSRFKDVGRLRQGDLVEFSVAQSEKGPQAVDVQPALPNPPDRRHGEHPTARIENCAAGRPG